MTAPVTFPYGETVLVRREQRDQFGDWTLADERKIHGVAFAPRTSTEPGGDRRTATVVSGLTMFAPPGSGLTAFHQVVRADGTTWQVQGDPGRWLNPFTGWEPADQIELERVEG